jgi:hypothetical protein
MPTFASLLGKWMGGPSGSSLIRVEQGTDGIVRGDWAGKSGGHAGFEGRMLDHGKKFRGFHFDLDEGISAGARFECTIFIALEDADPNVMTAKAKQKGGGETTWTAKR